jgi:hypothetical protein
MKSDAWASYQSAAELPDRDDEPEPEPWPAEGRSYPVLVAVAEDGRVLVMQAPPEFWTIARDVSEPSGAYYFGDQRRDDPAGVYRAEVTFRFKRGEGEFGGYDPADNDWWFDLGETLTSVAAFELPGANA